MKITTKLKYIVLLFKFICFLFSTIVAFMIFNKLYLEVAICNIFFSNPSRSIFANLFLYPVRPKLE